MTYIYLQALNINQGVWKESIKYGAQAIDFSRQIENPVIEGLGIYFMGYATFHGEERQKGIDLLRTGTEKIEATGASFTLGLGFGWRAEAHALADQEEEAQLCAKKSFDLAKIGERWGETVAYRALAIVAAKKEPPEWNKVDIHMRESLHLAEERGGKPEKAISCFRYAELLRNKGDMDQAMEYLSHAKALFTKMNMTWWIEQTENLKEKL